jgi:hypothetical protein
MWKVNPIQHGEAIQSNAKQIQYIGLDQYPKTELAKAEAFRRKKTKQKETPLKRGETTVML